jgi:hypothetical protein
MIALKLTKLNQQIKTIESLSSQLTEKHPFVTLDQNIGMVIIETYQDKLNEWLSSKLTKHNDQIKTNRSLYNLPNITIRSKQINIYTTSLGNVRSKLFQTNQMNVYHYNLANKSNECLSSKLTKERPLVNVDKNIVIVTI